MKARFKILIILAVFFALVGAGKAAILYLRPDNGSYSVGDIFFVKISVSSPDQAINAVQGTLTFNPKIINLVNFSKTGSIISLWVHEPTYSNIAGMLNFGGIILNPGYQGDNGAILVVSFAVKKAGLASLDIKNGSVLANDGLGTEIISNSLGAAYNLTSTLPTQITFSNTGESANFTTEQNPGSLSTSILAEELVHVYAQLTLTAEIMMWVILILLLTLLYELYRHHLRKDKLKQVSRPEQTKPGQPNETITANQPKQPDNSSYIEMKYAEPPATKDQNFPPHLTSEWLKNKGNNQDKQIEN